MQLGTPLGSVVLSSPDCIVFEVLDHKTFESAKSRLQVGAYVAIAEGNRDYVLATISSVRAVDAEGTPQQQQLGRFRFDCQPLGTLSEDRVFKRGAVLLPVPTEKAYLLPNDLMEEVFSGNAAYDFELGALAVNTAVPFKVHGNRLFGKHLAIVGSTGSGKSCAVANIIQRVVGISGGKNTCRGALNNSHVVIFDVHAEYAQAFRLDDEQKFTLNTLSVDALNLPYWMMNAEELESMFIESNEENSHNQVSQFKSAVVQNKKKHNSDLESVTYDTPAYFSLDEVLNYIKNMNDEIIGRLAGEGLPKLADDTLVADRNDYYFSAVQSFVPSSTAKASKASNGPFHGEFNRFISRLETKLSDERLRFMLRPERSPGTPYKTGDFPKIVKQFLGYLNKSNVTIVDVSGVPFEVLSVAISLIARLLFDFCFHYTKLRNAIGKTNDVPVLLVCEEAHNYVPRSNAAAYRASQKSIERIAKEGRKYGLSLMVVSQRPSEVSDTVFAQCNNFLALRLTNSSDQNYIRRLLPDSSASITRALPSLTQGECIAVGDAMVMPAIVRLELPEPRPQSDDVPFYDEWREPWRKITFEDVVKRWAR